MKILLVEDDQKATRLLSKGLREEGFAVDVAHDGDQGDELVAVNHYDAIILDWLLPGKDGVAICRDLRSRGLQTPVLMLTARQALSDRVTGLNTGADDYLTKPFAFAELLARIHALLRRSDLTRPVVFESADLTLDPRSHQVWRAGRRVQLTPREYAILEVLIRHPGHVVSRARVADSVWEEEQDQLTNLLDVHVSHLRRKIDRPGLVPLIHTVRGHGYRLGPGA